MHIESSEIIFQLGKKMVQILQQQFYAKKVPKQNLTHIRNNRKKYDVGVDTSVVHSLVALDRAFDVPNTSRHIATTLMDETCQHATHH